jgi:hypothetical protein
MVLMDLYRHADHPPACRYKEQDGTNANVSHGFKTMFAHFKEFDKKTISKATRDEVRHEHSGTCVGNHPPTCWARS